MAINTRHASLQPVTDQPGTETAPGSPVAVKYAVLMAMVYAGGHLFGGHYNPALGHFEVARSLTSQEV